MSNDAVGEPPFSSTIFKKSFVLAGPCVACAGWAMCCVCWLGHVLRVLAGPCVACAGSDMARD